MVSSSNSVAAGFEIAKLMVVSCYVEADGWWRFEVFNFSEKSPASRLWSGVASGHLETGRFMLFHAVHVDSPSKGDKFARKKCRLWETALQRSQAFPSDTS
jgi:hypothetical protein